MRTIEEVIELINNSELQLEGEIWKQHPVYREFYGSNFGRVKCCREYLTHYTSKGMELVEAKPYIKVQTLDKRYQRFSFSFQYGCRLNRKQISSQRFICECFYGMNDVMFCDHINSLPYDNRSENLKWSTRQENNNNPNSKEKHQTPLRKRPRVRIDQILKGEIIKVWSGARDIEDTLGLCRNSASNIIAVCNGHQKTAYGYTWKYHQEESYEGERWKEHPIRRGLEISNLGRARWKSKNGRIYVTQGSMHPCGYLAIEYHREKLLLNRLVAETFLENPQHKPQVNHINANHMDNSAGNLEWCTQRENMMSDKTHALASEPVLSFNENGDFVKEYSSIKMAARDGFHESSIAKCCQGRQRMHRGLVWRYKNREVEIPQRYIHPNSKAVLCINSDGIVVKRYDCIGDAMKDGFNRDCISLCCHGKMRFHKGYKWELEDK